VTDVSKSRSIGEKFLEHIGHNNEEVRRDRVTLLKALTAANPVSRHAVEHDSSLAHMEDVRNPSTPFGFKASSTKDGIEACP
jgi:hypothetical protein